ncbi:MAG: DUF5361 domain-containing protein [Clostridiales Family XIII bacterium]|jgi:hypothetical protein|nr:DUF5361 domain-containing protein [Clostridiales Family XIII bacterium]
MLGKAKDELTCDFRETYGLDLPLMTDPLYAATLALGLRPSSRTMMKLAGMQFPLETELMALQADMLRWLCWSKTKDGEKGRKRPKPILARARKAEELETFDTPEDFMEKLEEIRGNGDRG